jgi:uncharacterized lipoprotein YmbA
MRYRYTLLICTLSVAALAACASSPPSRYYALNSVAIDPVQNVANSERVIAVGPIDLPEYLNRPQIVTRRTGNELSLDELNRWAEPLRQAFQTVLCVDLRAALGLGDVHAYPIPVNVAVTHRVTGRVHRFEPDASGYAVLLIEWRLLSADGKPLRAAQLKEYRAASENGLDYNAVAAAMSQTIAQLAKDIATAL